MGKPKFMTAFSTVLPSPLGDLIAETTDRGICRLEFASRAAKRPASAGEHPHLKKLRAELARYFTGDLREFTVPLDPQATPFRERVWKQLRRIPYGAAISYSELARRIGNPKASRAVGGANGANPICIVVPCHRVVAADGSLGGYTAGLRRKERLLALERSGTLPPA